MTHKHHIIPVYHCKELGIDPNFDENFVMVERLDHALIHWGYKCNDLEPLFKYVTPVQWIIDLVPRGDNRDVCAAVILAEGEIDGIEPARGKDCPVYIPVLDLDGNEVEGSEDWTEKKRYYYRKCISEGIQPKTHEERAIIREEKELIYKKGVEEREEKRLEVKTQSQLIAKEKGIKVESVYGLRSYYKLREEGIDPNKKWREAHREENKDYAKWYYHNVQKPKNAKKKAERQGEGTLDAFLK